MSSSSAPSFPPAQQAQIIRANQRDLYHVALLREQTENVTRAWLGNRSVLRWDKELELLVKLVYFGLTSGRATQTLGEEYTDIWAERDGSVPPSTAARALLVLLPSLPPYVLAKVSAHWRGSTLLRRALTSLEVLHEINLAVFYIWGRGGYHDLWRRLLKVGHISSTPENPHTRPPSYSLLGVLIGMRLIYRLVSALRSRRAAADPPSNEKGKARQSTSNDCSLDDRSVSELVSQQSTEDDELPRPEEDECTALDLSAIPDDLRSGRNCTLCLEERMNSTVTECGHLFCWSCIVGWARERNECPLCRQSLSLGKLLPIYNL
ncbi:Pex12 amino terminal region-domain-containing protein [Schizophyllum amplum]|uniref:RING-type E3 ubiquitin transferase n=1 Tax=Schizophyllum amplum TaxID=97359 RepID=A0A550CLH0_9AGAR|nr:Pex12 amino terminal region-domain-containing protein [Auriculariopsis ampla]